MAYVGSLNSGSSSEGGLFAEANAAVRRDIMAVGPNVMSLAVPRKQ